MNVRILIGCLAVIGWTACNKQQNVPENVLSENEMVSALMEIYLAEEKAEAIGLTYDSLQSLFIHFEEKIFNKIGTDDSTFHQSMAYYMANPKKLERIYTALVDSLTLKAQESAIVSKKDALPE
jgi:hypothetical protein